DGDRLIAMALLRPGWEADYQGRPALYPVACLGKIVAEQRLDDGRFNLLLRGLCRVRIDHEVPGGKLYRSAPVRPLADVGAPPPEADRDLRCRLTERVPLWFPTQAGVLEQFRKLLKSELPLGALCDILAFALPLAVELKQELLEQPDVGLRVGRLLAHLEAA